MQEIDKLFLAKLADKVNLVKKKHMLESTDFLDEYQQQTAKKWFKGEHWKQVYFAGGVEQAERKIAILYPEKLENTLVEKPETILAQFIRVIQIELPKQIEPYTHKQYLGALMKLGIKREKIGDIHVNDKGAQILVKKEVENYLINALPELTRFSKSSICSISLEEIKWHEPEKIRSVHVVPSLRLDACIAEMVGCSRSKAIEILEEQRVWVNGELQIKRTRELKEMDKITVRGKGRFQIAEIKGMTKKDNWIIEIEKNK